MSLTHLAWFGAIVAEAHVEGFMPLVVLLLLAILNIPGVAAFMVVRRAGRAGLLPALTMAPLGAALGTATNLLFEVVGARVDISGFYNNAGLFTSLLLYGGIVCVVGGALGIWAGRKRDAGTPAPTPTPPASGETLPEMTVAPAPVAAELPQIRSD